MVVKDRTVTNSPTGEAMQSNRSEREIEVLDIKTETSPVLRTVHSPQSSTMHKESELELVGKQLGTNMHTDQDLIMESRKKHASRKSPSNSQSRSRSKSLSNINKVPKIEKIDKIQKFNNSKLENEYGYPLLKNRMTMNWEEKNKIMA